MFAPTKTLRGAMPARPAIVVLACAIALVAIGPRARAADDEKDKPPEPQDVTLSTSDNVTLAATYYPSNLAKDAVPVILLHEYKGSRADFQDLALKLQGAGHAVFAPDLRGHGDSVAADGALAADDFAAMVRRDLEAVKKFLVAENNAARLNIERLGVVGVEMGAVVAVNWAALDWSWPVLATGKQGQDVKGLVLISPQWSFQGLKINDAVAQPGIRSDLSMLIVTGRRGSGLLQEARRLHNSLARFHPAPPAAEVDEKQTLWLKTPPTSLQATQLLNEKSLQVHEMIVAFIELRLVNKPFAWSLRKSPLQ
jgi:pimeloyl-ACP methyl ester carboxylesterase